MGTIILILLFGFVSHLVRDEGKRRNAANSTIFLPHESSYCPGDEMFFDIVVEDFPAGPHTVSTNWKKEGRVNTDLTENGEIFRSLFVLHYEPPLDENGNPQAILPGKNTFYWSRTVPEELNMQPGESWVATVSIQYYHDGWDLFYIPFTIKDECL